MYDRFEHIGKTSRMESVIYVGAILFVLGPIFTYAYVTIRDVCHFTVTRREKPWIVMNFGNIDGNYSMTPGTCGVLPRFRRSYHTRGGQVLMGEAFAGSRRDYLEGGENVRQEIASSGPMLFVRHAGHTVGRRSFIANPKYSLTVGKRTKRRLSVL